MTDNMTSTSEENPPAPSQDDETPLVVGWTPMQLAPVELSAWLNIKETE